MGSSRWMWAALGVAVASSGAAAVPVVITHEGLVLDGQDIPRSGTLMAQFRLWDTPSGGANPLWTASCPVTLRLGRYAAELGTAPCDGGGIESGLLGSGAGRWLEVVLDGVALSPRARLAPVPLAVQALTAQDAASLGGQPASAYVRSASLSTAGAVAVNAANLTSGVVSSDRLSGTYGLPLSLTSTANTFIGNGAGLSGVDAASLGGQSLAQLDLRFARLTGGKVDSSVLPPVDAASVGGVTLSQLDARYARLTAGKVDASVLPADALLGAKAPVDAARTSCAASDKGSMYYNTADDLVYVCNGTQWKRVSQRPATLSWSAPSVALGSVTNAPAEATLTLQNVGDQPASSVVVAIPSAFTQVSTTCSSALAPQGSCAVVVALRPGTTAGPVSGTATATAQGVSTVSATLSGDLIGATSCKALKTGWTAAPTRTYWIDVDGTGSTHAGFAAYCDMDMDGGGWMLAMRLHSGSQDQYLTSSLNPADLAQVGAVSRLAKISDTTWMAINPAEHWSICGQYQTFYRRNQSVAYYSNHGSTSTCSYNRSFWTGMKPSAGASYYAPSGYQACGGADNGGWGTLSGIHNPDGQYFGCYSGVGGNNASTAPASYQQTNTNGWSSNGLVFIR